MAESDVHVSISILGEVVHAEASNVGSRLALLDRFAIAVTEDVVFELGRVELDVVLEHVDVFLVRRPRAHCGSHFAGAPLEAGRMLAHFLSLLQARECDEVVEREEEEGARVRGDNVVAPTWVADGRGVLLLGDDDELVHWDLDPLGRELRDGQDPAVSVDGDRLDAVADDVLPMRLASFVIVRMRHEAAETGQAILDEKRVLVHLKVLVCASW